MSAVPAFCEEGREASRAVAWFPRGAAWLSTVVALSLSSIVRAGPGTWTTGGPCGGFVYALAIDPTDSATVYAGTAGGVFKSTDSGATWTASSFGLTQLRVLSLAIDPSNPATLYVGTLWGGLSKSTDAGATWVTAGTGLPINPVYALAVDPSTPSTIYAGTYGGGVYKSSSSGGTWTAASNGLTHVQVQALAVDAANPATLYAGTAGGGIFKSANGGASWTPMNAGLTHLDVSDVAIDSASPATLYAATYGGGVFKSANAGGTWAAVDAGLTNLNVTALAVDGANPATLYAGTDGTGVFRSSDGGGSWAPASSGLVNVFVRALATSPAIAETVYVGTAGGGVFKSTDAGVSWAAANAGLAVLQIRTIATSPSAPGKLYAGSYGGGVFKSGDSGATWAAASAGLTTAYVGSLAVDPTLPSTLYAGTGDGVFKSTDGGNTWTRSGDLGTVYALAIDPTTPTTLYAGTFFNGVFKSLDSGGTWAAVNAGLTTLTVNALAIDPATPSTLYAATDGGSTFGAGGVFRSTDSGATWTPANTGLPGGKWNARGLAIDPGSPATLYSGLYDDYGSWCGLYKSTNAGASWTVAQTGLGNRCVRALSADPARPGTVYAGTSGGVFVSADAAGSWASTGLTLAASALALDPMTATAFAGTDTGVWQRTVVANLAITLSDSPDPVFGTTALTYTLAVANAGPGDASGVSVVHTLPAGVLFGSATGSGWTCSHSAGVVTCTRPRLAVGTAPAIAVVVTPGPTSAVLGSSATVSAAETDLDLLDNTDAESTTVTTPLVWMGTRTKTVLADAGGFVINGGVTYTITLANAGSGAQADNPGHELADTLPSVLSLVSADATSGTVAADLPGNTVSWDGSLPSGGSVTVTIHAGIKPMAYLGQIVSNQAAVSYDADADGTNDATTLTDDPDEPGASDPTGFVVVSPPQGFFTLQPCRLLDTRLADGTYGGPALRAGDDRVFPLFGRCGIPTTARAVSVNLTATQSAAQGNLRLYPAGTPLPLVSSVNYVVGLTRANNAVVPLNGLGEIAVRCSQASGTTHFVLDVNGYFE